MVILRPVKLTFQINHSNKQPLSKYECPGEGSELLWGEVKTCVKCCDETERPPDRAQNQGSVSEHSWYSPSFVRKQTRLLLLQADRLN